MVAFFKRIYRGNIIYAIALAVIGVIFIVWPEAMRTALVRVFGILTAAAGAFLIFMYFRFKPAKQIPVNVVAGALLIVLGVLIIAKPASFVDFIIILAGAAIMISGVMNFCQTLTLASLHFPFWWVAMIMSILTIILSVLVISKPGQIADVVFVVAGAFMIYDGASNLWIAWKLHKFAKGLHVPKPSRKEVEETIPDDLMDELP